LGARNRFVAVAVVDPKYQDVAGVTMHGLRDVDGKGRFTASGEATSWPFGEKRQRSLTLAKSSRGRGLLHALARRNWWYAMRRRFARKRQPGDSIGGEESPV
jgi:hypothetical protein